MGLRSIITEVRKQKMSFHSINKIADKLKKEKPKNEIIIADKKPESTVFAGWQNCKQLKTLSQKEYCKLYLCFCKKEKCPPKFREKQDF